MIAVLIILRCSLVNAFFVTAEFAIVGAPRAAIDARAARKDRLARLVQGVLAIRGVRIATSRPRRSASRVASLGLGMYGEHVIADWILARLARPRWPQWLAAHGFASAPRSRS